MTADQKEFRSIYIYIYTRNRRKLEYLVKNVTIFLFLGYFLACIYITKMVTDPT